MNLFVDVIWGLAPIQHHSTIFALVDSSVYFQGHILDKATIVLRQCAGVQQKTVPVQPAEHGRRLMPEQISDPVIRYGVRRKNNHPGG